MRSSSRRRPIYTPRWRWRRSGQARHVYCEKPIGVTPAQVRAVVEAVKKSNKVFVPGQQLRSMKEYIEAVRKIREGIIGDVIMIKAQRHATSDLPHDGTSADWYFDVNRSGGYLIEQSVHNLDLCNWAIGAHPTRACGFGGILLYKNNPPGRTIFDCGTISYDYPGGVMMSFTQNVFHPRGMPNGNQYIYVYGTKGAVNLMGTPTMYALSGESKPVVLDREGAAGRSVRAYRGVLQLGSERSETASGHYDRRDCGTDRDSGPPGHDPAAGR